MSGGRQGERIGEEKVISWRTLSHALSLYQRPLILLFHMTGHQGPVDTKEGTCIDLCAKC